MPKTNNPLMKAKTSPGVSYIVPTAKLIEAVTGDDFHSFLVELDALEEALLEAAARDVIEATIPGYRGARELPIIIWKGRTCLRVSGQFPPVLKGPDGKPRKAIKAGATVTMRTMLKCWPTAGKGVTVFAFPSRIDVQAKTSTRKTKPTSQLTMALPLPVKTVVEPAPIRKPEPAVKAPGKAKPGPKPKPPAKAPAKTVRFDKAAFAAERARIVEARLRVRKAMAAETTKAPAPARKTKPKPAPALPDNVILFPVHRTRRPA